MFKDTGNFNKGLLSRLRRHEGVEDLHENTMKWLGELHLALGALPAASPTQHHPLRAGGKGQQVS